jgi:hypothetical protein
MSYPERRYHGDSGLANVQADGPRPRADLFVGRDCPLPGDGRFDRR